MGLALLATSCSKEAPYGVAEQSETFTPEAIPWNGVKVYLSSPRHASSGSRGECGWEENVNGRTFNLYAAHLNDESPGDATLTDRGYEVRVSPNTRDDGWRLNRDESDNWGANVHLVTHSNAFEGCGSTAQYLLVMFKTGDANSMDLRTELLGQLDPQVPGGQNTWNCDGLGECAALAEHTAYIELFFHTNQAAVDWFTGPLDDPDATGAEAASPYLGIALDEHLGYPRATPSTESPLDQYPGFGRSADATLRDLTIAYAEAYEREESIAACMADAGFTYQPAVAFPNEDTQAVAESLGVEAAAARPSPWATNDAYEQGLPGPERDRYFRTLLGESAADIDEADRTGAFPAGRGADFATGGCHGAVRAEAPSIWDAPRTLNTTLSGILTELPDGPAMAATRSEYGQCVASAAGLDAATPADVQEIIAADADADGGPADAVRAYEDCSDVWAAGYQDAAQTALAAAADEHTSRLAEIADRYEGATTRIAEDDDLRQHLATAIAPPR